MDSDKRTYGAEAMRPETDGIGEQVRRARGELRDALAAAKRKLVAELRTRAEDDDALVVCAGGGTGVGRGELDLYRWIPVLYRVGDTEYAYQLALSQQDVDAVHPGGGTRASGNIHEVFGKLQFWRLGEVCNGKDDSGFVGGVPHGRPVQRRGAYLLEYCADKAYPIAERASLKKTAKPWGLDVAWPGGRPPVLDIGSEDYDATYAVECFLLLVREDVRQRSRGGQVRARDRVVARAAAGDEAAKAGSEEPKRPESKRKGSGLKQEALETKREERGPQQAKKARPGSQKPESKSKKAQKEKLMSEPRKTLVVGDMHLKQAIILPRVEAAAVLGGVERIVFLGDYCDEWHASDRRFKEMLKLFADWVRATRTKGVQVDVLLGNHDFQYLIGEKGPGTRLHLLHDVREQLLPLDPVMAADVNGFLVTHAGVTQSWADWFLDEPLDAASAAAQLNGFYRDGAFRELFTCGPGRGGNDLPGPLWADSEELWADALPNISQIAGHTPVRSCECMEPATSLAGGGNARVYLCDTFSLTSDRLPIGDASMLLVGEGEPKAIGRGDGVNVPYWEDAVDTLPR